MGGWKQKEESSLLFLLLSCFYISRLSVSVSRMCAPTLPLTNKYNYKYYTKNNTGIILGTFGSCVEVL